MMAAGVIVVAHQSGGPLTDIVCTSDSGQTGYLACSADQYADSLLTVLTADSRQLADIRTRAR